jgi:hypothetical protein
VPSRPAAALIVAVLLLDALGARSARGQDGSSGTEPHAAVKTGKELHAFRVSGVSPAIDGALDDEAWATAQTIEDFVQEEPDNMAPPTEDMAIRIAYDDRYLYVAVQMFMREPSDIRAGLSRRGSAPPSDRILLGFDPAHDHLTAYIFEANASGVQNDYLLVDDTRTNNDYEAVWEVVTRVSEDGWTAEFRIPFLQMRFPVTPGQRSVWGFNVRRDLQLRGESDWWIARARGTAGLVSLYGHLIFDEPIAPPRRLEVIPYTLGRVETKPNVGADGDAAAGVDVRLGLGTSATIPATINPDFGQVELDPAVLNLSVFETFFPEKRPFFLEDSRVFTLSAYAQFPDFYSRRIGRTPGRYALEANETLVSKPSETTILGAAKLTGGRTPWTYGWVGALTAKEYAIVDQTTTNAGGDQTVRRIERLIEPQTFYNVGRLQRDFRNGSSNVGAIGTAVVRDGDADTFTGGGDASIRWDENRYTLNSHWVATRAPIDGVLRNGEGGVANFEYDGKYLGFNAHADHFSRSFHNTDLGFLFSRKNKNEVSGSLNLNQPDPWRIFRRVGGNVFLGRQWNDEGLRFGSWINTGGNMTFKNFWGLYFNTGRNFRRYDDLDTRGGPAIVRPADRWANFGIFSDSRKSWGLSLNLQRSRGEEGGWNTVIGPQLRLQPTARITTSIGANYTLGRDVAQWIKNTDADADGETDYVYGRLRRDVVSITGRATYAFSRDLTLEAFLQPFVAVGDYTDIRKLARPKSFEFSPVTLDSNPDFNRKSLRGTVVMRWEYVRGSSLFAVWNLATSDTSRPGVFSPWRDLTDTFSAPATSVFAIKINYWFTP